MIVVCGEALIDRIHNGDGTQRAAPGGGPFNAARALARLGVPTGFLGRLSEDVFGRQLAGLLVSEGASLELASVGPEPTGAFVSIRSPIRLCVPSESIQPRLGFSKDCTASRMLTQCSPHISSTIFFGSPTTLVLVL